MRWKTNEFSLSLLLLLCPLFKALYLIKRQKTTGQQYLKMAVFDISICMYSVIFMDGV